MILSQRAGIRTIQEGQTTHGDLNGNGCAGAYPAIGEVGKGRYYVIARRSSPTGLEAWEPNIDFVMGQRTYVLTMTSIGPNMVSIPIVYTARQNHTSSSDDQPPNTTYWRTGDGSATQPIQAEWLLFNLRNLHRWEPAGLLGADKFVDKGVLPLDADARINSATFLEGNYYFCFTQSGTLINPWK